MAVPDLPPKLEAVLIRICRASSLNVTQAVKLPYLIDVVAKHVLGRPITEGAHEAWENGVVTSPAWHYLTKRTDSKILHLEPVRYSEERKVVIDVEEDSSVLDAEERQIVDAVLAEYGSTTASELGLMTKVMNTGIARWGSNHRASLSEDAYDRMSSEYQEMADAVSRLSLRDLERDYVVIESGEEAVA